MYGLFGSAAVLTLVAVGAVIMVVHFGVMRSRAEDSAARAAGAIVAPVLEEESDSFAEFATAAETLVGDHVRSIRLIAPDGAVLVSSGNDAPASVSASALAAALDGESAVFKSAGGSGDVLISYHVLASGDVVEIQQDYAQVAGSVAVGQRVIVLSLLGGLALLLLLIQAGIWLTTNRLKRDYTRMLELHRSGQAVRASLDLDEVLEQLARNCAAYTSARLGAAMLVDDTTNDLVVRATYDADADSTAQHYRAIEEWYVRRCAGTGEPVQTQLEAPPYEALLAHRPDIGVPVVVLCVPILARDVPIGVLLVARDVARGTFKEAEIEVVEEMAAQAAMALDQALLFDKVRSHAQDLELSYDSTLKVLVAALDTKDTSTHRHSERVSQLAVTLAKELGFPEERLLDVERGALLHDVGKIGVPDHVLRKPDELDEGEWEAMEKHPLLAGLMVSKVGFLEGAMPILLYHHERYDGGGYPFGLEGRAIPLEARVFAVVDSYDAMTSDRPYRKAMSDPEALAEIDRASGTQFDPLVVEAFVRMMERRARSTDEAA